MSRFTAQLFKHLHAPISSSGRRRRRKRPTIHSLLSRLRTPSRTAPNWFHAVVNKIRVHLDSVSKKRKQRFFGVKSGDKSYRSYFVETFVNIIRNKNITIWFVNIPETYFEVFQPIIEKDYIYDWFENKRFDSFYFQIRSHHISYQSKFELDRLLKNWSASVETKISYFIWKRICIWNEAR